MRALHRAFLGMTLAAAAFSASATLASAKPFKFEGEYTISVRGLSVGKARFTGKVEGNDYDVRGALWSSGLARMFAKTDASSRSRGSLETGTALPASFNLNYEQDGKKSRTRINFEEGKVVRTRFTPKWKPAKGVIPVKEDHLRKVADPVSAVLMARGTPEQVCGRTLRIFEGGTRIDVRLKLDGVAPIENVSARAVTCKGKFIPVAGMSKKDKTYKQLAKDGNFEFVYVPAGGGGLYMLHSLTAQTDVGQVQMLSWRRQFGS